MYIVTFHDTTPKKYETFHQAVEAVETVCGKDVILSEYSDTGMYAFAADGMNSDGTSDKPAVARIEDDNDY